MTRSSTQSRFRRRAFSAGALSLCLAAAGCSSPPTRYYRILAVPGPVASTAALSVAVRGVSLPAYLDKDQIIIGALNGTELALDNNTIWAAPLSAMLQAVLVQNLAQRLPNAAITASGGAIGMPAASLLELDVLQFDPGAGGAIILTAQAALKSTGGPAAVVTRRFTAQATPASAGPAATAATMTSLWGALADQLAKMVVNEDQ